MVVPGIGTIHGFCASNQASATCDGTDLRNVVPRFTPENRKASVAFVAWLTSFGEKKKATPARSRSP